MTTPVTSMGLPFALVFEPVSGSNSMQLIASQQNYYSGSTLQPPYRLMPEGTYRLEASSTTAESVNVFCYTRGAFRQSVCALPASTLGARRTDIATIDFRGNFLRLGVNLGANATASTREVIVTVYPIIQAGLTNP